MPAPSMRNPSCAPSCRTCPSRGDQHDRRGPPGARPLAASRHDPPTREGWWCLAVTLGLGVTAMNTGNNLLYLLESMVLALIVVSGVLSEQSVRGIRVIPRLPDAIHAGTPCLLG